MRSIFDNKISIQTRSIKRPDHVVLSTEERNDGKVGIENEVVIYAKLNNMTILDSLSREDQEQYSFSFNTSNTNGQLRVVCRVRKTIKDNVATYVRTTKVFSEESSPTQISQELPIETNEEEFNLYKTFCENGMIKSRFFLPFTTDQGELTYEFDLYPNPSGGFYEWVKIDVEIPEGMTPDYNAIMNSLPPELSDMIVKSTNNTDEEKAKISELYQNYFLTKV